jgi:hypothetical protein
VVVIDVTNELTVRRQERYQSFAVAKDEVKFSQEVGILLQVFVTYIVIERHINQFALLSECSFDKYFGWALFNDEEHITRWRCYE